MAPQLARSVALWLAAASWACNPLYPVPPRNPSLAAADPRVSTEGLILSVERPKPEDSQSFVHLVITPGDQKPVRVDLAPGWYLDEQGLSFKPNDRVSVEGRQVTADGESRIVAERLTQGERVFVLRDGKSPPAWQR